MLHYDVEWNQLLGIGEEINATDKQVVYSLSRAMRRTEATLRRMSSTGLTKILHLRVAATMRKRLKSIKMRMSSPTAREQGMGLWYGLNDLPVSSFKGRPRKTAGGAIFRGQEFSGAFVGRSKVKGRQTIFKRVKETSLPIAEQQYPIESKAIEFIEDEVFDKVLEVFWQHFKRDLQARVKYKLGES